MDNSAATMTPDRSPSKFRSLLNPRSRTPSPSKGSTLRELPNGRDVASSRPPIYNPQAGFLPADHPHAQHHALGTENLSGNRHNVLAPETEKEPGKRQNAKPGKTNTYWNTLKSKASKKDLMGQKDKEITAPNCTFSSKTAAPIWAPHAPEPCQIIEDPSKQVFDDSTPSATRGYQQELRDSTAHNVKGDAALKSQQDHLEQDLPSASSLPKERRTMNPGTWMGKKNAIKGMQLLVEDSSAAAPEDAQIVSTSELLISPRRYQRQLDAGSDSSTSSCTSKISLKTASSMSSMASSSKKSINMSPEELHTAFEAVLESRNIPEHLRQNMRMLDNILKADFVRHGEFETSRRAKPAPDAPLSSKKSWANLRSPPIGRGRSNLREDLRQSDETGKSPSPSKRGRSRSRGFVLGRGEQSLSKQPRTLSRPRSLMSLKNLSTSSLHAMGFDGAKESKEQPSGTSTVPASPDEFVEYLQTVQRPKDVEIGKLHKLRLLTRNESIGWVDEFVSQDGMKELLGLLDRIVDIEWRDEHDDLLLHEVLLCLKGLCTTHLGVDKLGEVESTLFPNLLHMLFDQERKGPSEFNTRGVVIYLLSAHLAAATPKQLTERARTILQYLSDPLPTTDQTPLGFILQMRQSRPYQVWCKEMSNVTKEVFWIFLHHQNVIDLPAVVDESDPRPYCKRHFPKDRPPVAAAPYVGGVEWEATNYLATHLDLMNALIAATQTPSERNALREDFKASGFERLMGKSLRICKEKFYGAVHEGLRTWVAAAAEDGWEVATVRTGPVKEDRSPSKSPSKEAAPKLQLSNFDLGEEINVKHL